MASSNATAVLSARFLMDETGMRQLGDFASAVNSLTVTNYKFEGTPNIDSRLTEINVLLEAILQRDPSKRLPLDVLQQAFGAFHIRSCLEHDCVDCLMLSLTSRILGVVLLRL
jgi:hypothetical protein